MTGARSVPFTVHRKAVSGAVEESDVEMKTVGVGYASDLSKVKAVLEGVVKTETAVIKDEPVDIFVSDLGDSAVDMGIRVWVKTEDYWPVRWRLLEQMKNALDENGISIPFPQMDVSIRKE